MSSDWPKPPRKVTDEKGRFRIPDQGWPSYAHPVVSDGRLYLRDQSVLYSYDVRAR